jgi:hypothetical protein
VGEWGRGGEGEFGWLNAAFLGHVRAVGEEFGHYFQARDDVGGAAARELAEILKNSVDAPVGEKARNSGAQMDVAGTGGEGRR